MRILALDVGERRIGVAISDESGTIALPHGMIPRGPGDMQAITQLAADEGVCVIVLGLPVTLRGTRGHAVEKVTGFAMELSAHTSAQIVTWDERLSTVVAERAMLAENVSPDRRKRQRDKLAATIILQDYLQAQSRNT